MEMKTIKVNGIDLAYWRQGKGAPLLLIHGFPLDHTIWGEVASFLEHDFDLILPDLRGFGESTTTENPYQISDMADDLATLLDHLGIKKITIAGHSMGGYVALAFAKKYPQRVGGLALISSQARGDSPEGKEGRYKTAQAVGEKGVGVVVEAMTAKLSANSDIQAILRELMAKQKPSGIMGALKAMAEREDFSQQLASLQQHQAGTVSFPIVLIHGDADALIPLERAQEISSALSSAKLVVLQGAGHMPMMEFAKETAKALETLK